MYALLSPLSAIFLGASFLLIGNGLQNILLPSRAAIEGFPTVTIGLVMSGYYVGFLGGCFLGPWLVRRAGHIRTFAALASIASTAALAHVILVDPAAWFGFRIVTGACYSAMFMVVESWINEKTPNSRRGAVLSVYRVIDLGSNVVGQLTLNLAPAGDFTLFVVASILVSLALVPVSMTTTATPREVKQVKLRLGRLFRVSPLGFVCVAGVGLSNSAFWAMSPVFAKGIGLSSATITLMMSAAILGGALTQIPVGRLSDRIDRRLVITVILCGGAITSFAMAAIGGMVAVGDLPTEAILASAFAMGAMILPVYPLTIAYVNDWTAPEDFVETSGGLILTFGIGASCGPLLGSTVMDAFGVATLYVYTGAISSAIAAFAVYRMIVRRSAARRDVFVAVPRTSPQLFALDPRRGDRSDTDGADGDASGAETATDREPDRR